MQSPINQIAHLRTKWRDGNHIETVFYDHRGRVIEAFTFGQSSSKELHYYEGDQRKKSIYYSHGESSTPGYVSIDTVRRDFDANGRLILEYHATASLPESTAGSNQSSYKRHFKYTASGDTLTKLEPQLTEIDTPLVNIDHWERNMKSQLVRHYQLYVLRGPDATHPDTVNHYSQRFAYDPKGRLKLAWFDSMYLGTFYLAAGPDTIWYYYNAQNRLTEERHLYSTDMRNKREVDTTKLSRRDSEVVNLYRKNFINNEYGWSNRKYVIKYKYEKFDPAKHGRLIIPTS
ncbi:hypothetical protein ASG33_02035 [Dyadobacter sp. Leaf189]|nr:hypothetical protein ASG33_02035 [Dyadobacter sp. Leaf189]